MSYFTIANNPPGVNRGDAVPSTAQLAPGERRIRLAMALFLPALQEEIDQMSPVDISTAENGMVSDLHSLTTVIC